jgi:hypothetical protein
VLQRPRVLQEPDGLFVSRHGTGRNDRRRSVAGVRADRRLERREGAIHEIRIVPTVHVEVDKTGGHETTGRIDGRSGRCTQLAFWAERPDTAVDDVN